MSGMCCFVYIAWNNYRYVLNYSFDPLLDLKYYNMAWDCQQLQLLTPALPLGIAYGVLKSLATPQEQLPRLINHTNSSKSFLQILKKSRHKEAPLTAILRKKNEQAAIVLKKLGITDDYLDLYTLDACYHTKLPKASDKDRVYRALKGRALYLEEIEDSLSGQAVKVNLENILQVLYLEGKIKLLPAVAIMPDGASYCLRCGGTESIKSIVCLECGDDSCCHCEECLAMGEAKSCRPFYVAPNYDYESCKDIDIKVNFPLTLAQRDASRTLASFVASGEKNELLIWAACGAGKTEVTYAAIAHVLGKGGRVLYAVPRRQVAMQLAKRFQKVFSSIDIAVLYGGSPQKYKESSLILATTHQTLRLYHNFDLVILDEQDAYPYRCNRMLHYAVKRACKEGCHTIYLTATPRKELQEKVKSGKIDTITIPARHHGYPLPVPSIEIEKELVYKNDSVSIPQSVLQNLHLSLEGDLAQVLVFVPTIYLAEKVAEELQRAIKMPPFNNFKGDWVQFSHSKDPERDKKVDGFFAGEFPILVTTTIMERGITIPRVNVMVLFADYEQIFDTGTLVQIAGRSGRLGQYPEGKVWFIASSKTHAMSEAVSWIRNMNNEARRKGYLIIPPKGEIKNAF